MILLKSLTFINIFLGFNTAFTSDSVENVARVADDSLDTTEGDEVWGNVVIEPSIQKHVANGGAHGDEVETKEREIVISEI